MPEPCPRPGAPDRAQRWFWAGAVAVGVVAVAAFSHDLAAEVHFVDESAYLSQTYFADLFFKGESQDPAWLDYPAYDLPPLPKYMIGLALRGGGFRRPSPWAARAWYADTSSRFDPPGALVLARWPSVIFGALGCLAIFGLGTLAGDRRVGALAALLVIVNPLYRLHARRAMSDVPAEALILCSSWGTLWAWRRRLAGDSGPMPWVVSAVVGVCTGLAALAKLNGILAIIIVLAWTLLTLVLPRIAIGRKLAVMAMAAIAGTGSLITFVALNPFLTARPRRPLDPPLAMIAKMSVARRMRLLVEHRMAVSRGQKVLFPNDALKTPLEKLKVLVVQGFGRFGPFGPRHSDSTRRYDAAQDWGAPVWIACVIAGVPWWLSRGKRQVASGEPPTAWAILVKSFAALAVVTAYLPLAWDRYFLSIQPGSALLAAGATVAAADSLIRARPRRGPIPTAGAPPCKC